MGISALPSPEYRTLSHEIARAIRNAILTGNLRGGDRLVEAAIAERMGVSRAPVREAIMILEKQGLVTNAPRKGAFVVQWSKADIEEVYTLRVVLEGLAARLAATRITPQESEQMQNIIDRLRHEGDSLNVEDSIELDLQFHELLWHASKHSRLCSVLTDMRVQMAFFIGRSRSESFKGAEALNRLANQHQEILDVLRSGDAALADERMREHVERAGQHVIDRIKKEESRRLKEKSSAAKTNAPAKEDKHEV